MAVKIKYLAPKGYRVSRYFMWIEPERKDMGVVFLNDKQKLFNSYQEAEEFFNKEKEVAMLGNYYFKVKTIRAFRRWLKKNGKKGKKYTLINHFYTKTKKGKIISLDVVGWTK